MSHNPIAIARDWTVVITGTFGLLSAMLAGRALQWIVLAALIALLYSIVGLTLRGVPSDASSLHMRIVRRLSGTPPRTALALTLAIFINELAIRSVHAYLATIGFLIGMTIASRALRDRSASHSA